MRADGGTGRLEAEERRRQPGRTFDRLTMALLLLSLASVLSEPLRIHHDPANLLTASLRWVEGRARLADVAGMNLPLALYVYAVPALLSHVLGVHPIPLFKGLTLLFLVASTAACRRLLGREAPGEYWARALVGVAVAGLVLTTLEGPERTFGQREVYYLALVLPFLIVRWRRAERAAPGTAASIAAGVAGALGGLLKPQLMLPLACAEAALWIGGRRPRLVRAPENLAFAGTGILYALHFLLLPRDVLGAFGTAVAGAAGGYRAYDAPLSGMLLRYPVLPAVLVSVAALAAARAKGSGALTRLSASFAGLTIGGLAVYLIQHKGFPYHLVPVVAGTALSATALVAGDAARSLRESWRRAFERAAATFRAATWAAVLYAVASCLLAAAQLPDTLEVEPLIPFEEYLCSATVPREELLVVTTSVGPVYPALIRMDRRPFGRWIGPFMGIAFAHAGDPREGPPRYPTRAEMRADERAVLDALARDLKAAPPRLVLVAAEPPHQGLPIRFDLVEYLRVGGFVDDALGAFERVKDRAGFAVWRLRTPKGAGATSEAGPASGRAGTADGIGAGSGRPAQPRRR